MNGYLEKKVLKLLIKLRTRGHPVDVDALAHSVHDEHREIGLQVIKDRIRLHIERMRTASE